MAANLFKAPSINFGSTSINGAINSSVDTITLNSTANLKAPGYIVIDRQNSSQENTPNAREVVSYTGISGSDLTGCGRAADGSTARSHADGALVEPVLTVGMWNDQQDFLAVSLSTVDGSLRPISSATITTSSLASVSVIYSSLATVTLTSPTINTGVSGTAISAGSDITTGTDNTKIVTAKAIKDGTLTGQAIASPILSGAGATAEGTLGFDTTDHAILVGDGTNNSPIHIYHWKAYTPTTANITKGSGALAGAYCKIGKTVIFRISFTLAADSAMGTGPTFTLPVTGTGSGLGYGPIDVTITDTGTSFFKGMATFSTTVATIWSLSAASATLVNAQITSSVPMTWTTGDVITISGVYEAA